MNFISNGIIPCPAGPAGTGKTETAKDLAKEYGKSHYVINTSDQMTPEQVEKILIGMVSSGSWVMMDEFNRM